MTNALPPLPELHLLEEVAEKYKLSLIGMQRLARSRGFTHIKIGKKRYLTHEQVVSLLLGNTVTASKADKRAADMAGVAARRSRAKAA